MGGIQPLRKHPIVGTYPNLRSHCDMDAWSKRRNNWFCCRQKRPYWVWSLGCAQTLVTLKQSTYQKGRHEKSWVVNQNSWQTFQSHDISQTWLSSSRPIRSFGHTRQLHWGGEGRGVSISNEPTHNLKNKWNDTLRTRHRACTILSRYFSLSLSLLYWAVPFYERRGACVLNRLILFTNFPYCANRRIV